MYKVNPDIGEIGLQVMHRGGWDWRHFVSLGQAGPGRHQNAYWLLLKRNETGASFDNKDPPDAVNFTALRVAARLVRGTRGLSEYTLKERLSSEPKSLALFDALPMKIGTLSRIPPLCAISSCSNHFARVWQVLVAS